VNVSNAHRAYRKLSTYEQGSAHIENSNCREGVASDSIYTTLDERVYIDALPREPKRMTIWSLRLSIGQTGDWQWRQDCRD